MRERKRKMLKIGKIEGEKVCERDRQEVFW